MTDFPIINILENAWEDILGELKNVIENSKFVQWPERELYAGRWDVYGLYGIDGKAIPENVAACPKTTAVVQSIPGMRTAGFSKLASRCTIKPHIGYTDAVLRCHLGLIIPDGDCGLRVGDIVYTWKPGKAFIFDDRIEHEAWNRSGGSRYVLLVDFQKPVPTPWPST
jgi:beta-hydroxylase